MSKVLMVPALMFALGGCATESDGPNFGGGGVGATDGGTTDGGATWTDDGVSPYIDQVTAEFYTPPNSAVVVEVYVYWTDAQADVEDGQVYVSLDDGNGGGFTGTLDITGKLARLDDDVEGDPVFFWVGDVDASATYDVEVQLFDVAGNASQVATTTTN